MTILGQDEESEGNVTQKHDKFRELAEGRTNKALEAIVRLGKLSNRQLYEWDDAEVRKITKALRDAVAEVEKKFSAPKGAKENKFKL